MNRQASLQTKKVTKRPRIPWFNAEIKSPIRVKQIAACKWRKTKSVCECDLAALSRGGIMLLSN